MTQIIDGNANVAALLKRVFMFLEDGDWQSANTYCERVLDVDPENPSAYLGKLMADLHVKRQEDLQECSEPFDTNSNYEKAVRFSDKDLRNILTSYVEHINARNKERRLSEIYDLAKGKMSAAKTESDYKKAAETFSFITDYKDSEDLLKECYDRAEAARKEAAELAELKRKKAAELAERKRKEAEEKQKRTKKTVKIVVGSISATLLCVAFVIVLIFVIIPNVKYNNAVELMRSEKYAEAITAFEKLENFRDSEEKISECKYEGALNAIESGDYEASLAAFLEIRGYRDSDDYISRFKICPSMKTTDSDGEVSSYTYTYDENGNLLREMSGSGTYTEYTYDDNGNMIEEFYYSSLLPSLTKYEYDNEGNLIKKIVASSLGQSLTEYEYDDNGNLQKENFTSIVNWTETYQRTIQSTTVYTYDDKGNLIKEVTQSTLDNSTTVRNYEYDNRGNVLKEVITRDGEVSSYEYTYDSRGNNIKYVYTDSEGKVSTTEYTYDNIGNTLKHIYTNSDGEISTDEYTYEDMRIIYVSEEDASAL